ncbi:MAG: hypothetical protein U5Q03_06460 [Bacteroidota bacterium]|nr:hypothetical protein [Bacteroidota bacterium]
MKSRRNNPALWNGQFGGSYERISTDQNENIYMVMRIKNDNAILGVFNLSPQEIEFSLDQNIFIER